VSPERYVLGLVLAGIAFAPLAVASRAWRGRLAPRLDGPVAVLADVVLTASAIVCGAELLGSLDLFRLVPVVVVFSLFGACAWWVARRVGPAAAAGGTEPKGSLRPRNRYVAGQAVLALVATSVLIADWTARTISAYRRGMTTTDTLWYHMPVAARFVQEGSITGLHYVDTNAVTVFYPDTSELFHALGIMFFGNDFFSPVMNMGWMAVVLLSAWCIGRPFGASPAALTASTVLLVTPGLVATQPGGAYTDTVGAAFLLASLALLVDSEHPDSFMPGTLALAALAAGLAMGTKFTFVASVGLLTLGVFVLLPRGRRIRHGGMWLGLVLLTGSFWYFRNLAYVGNPLPSLAFHLGPFRLPSPPIQTPTASVSQYLANGWAWRNYFLPGFRQAFGPVWWATLGYAAVGLSLQLVVGRNKVHRMLAVVGAGSIVAFVFTPQFLGVPGVPGFFVYNLRYALPGLMIGLVLLPLLPILGGNQRQLWLCASLVAIVGLTQLDSSIWPTNLLTHGFGPPVGGVETALGVLTGLICLVAGGAVITRRQTRRPWPLSPGAVLGMVALALVAAYPLSVVYFDDRYTSTTSDNVFSATAAAWAQHLEHTRIALVGFFTIQQYQYYGPDSSNYVQYVERIAPDGAPSPYPDCADWLRALQAGHYSYLISASGPEDTWTQMDPVDRHIRVYNINGFPLISVFRLGNHLDLSGCRAQKPSSRA